MEIRAARRSDVIAICGDAYAQSLRAIVVEHEGKPVGIAGVLHTSPHQCFSEMSDEMRQSPKTIVKVARAMREILNSYDTKVYAIASIGEKNSSRFLEFVGFNQVKGDLYIWPQLPPT